MNQFVPIVRITLGGPWELQCFNGMFVLISHGEPGFLIAIQGCEHIYQAVAASHNYIAAAERVERGMGKLLDELDGMK